MTNAIAYMPGGRAIDLPPSLSEAAYVSPRPPTGKQASGKSNECEFAKELPFIAIPANHTTRRNTAHNFAR